MPFSVGSNGAKAYVETKLQLTGTSKDSPAHKCSQPRSIIFENPHPVNSPTSNVNSILGAVKDTAKTVGITVNANTAKEFVNLVRIMRVSNKDDLLAVYNQVKAGVGFSDKVAAKRLFLDALLRAGNGDTVETAIALIKNKELTPIEEKLVYFGLSFVRHPTEASLEAATVLLNQVNLPREAYLGIGTLVGRYCRSHSCKNIEAVNKLSQRILTKLGDGKAANRDEENEFIYILKALANVHHVSDSITTKLIAIAQDKKAPNRLRVAALETYLADACKDKLRNSALGILKDIQQDSEVRIKAYLVLAQCPNAKIGNAIKALLENEPSLQVGGFISSHIRTIRNSANPDKDLAKQHLGFIGLSKKYPIDLRKYSFNGEMSYSVDTLGMANSIETNVIYSQQSFLPRSTKLNLTAELFGHTFNFLELDMRQENFDRLLEHYFGPQGLFRSKDLIELLNSKTKDYEGLYRKIDNRILKLFRERRDVTKEGIDQIGKQVQIKTNELNKNLDLDFSMKAFGSELLFVNINDDAKKFTPEAMVDKLLEQFDKGLNDLKGFDRTLRANLLFLDAELSYPTTTGFPLRLGIEGSAHVQVKAAGAVDVHALLHQDTKVKLTLIPSANIQLAGRLTLDSFIFENGLKVTSNLHTATGGDIVVDLFNKRRGVDVKFALPLEKQNIVSATHEIVFHKRNLGHPEINTPLKFAQGKDFSICVDHLSPLIGLVFCGDINGPNLSGKQLPVLPFPFAGDANVAITVEKEDLSHYHFRATTSDNDKIGTEIQLESYDKANNKKVSLQLEAFLKPEKYIRVSLSSPIKKALVEGRITNDKTEKSISVKFSHDDQEFLGKVGISVSGNDARSVYKPIFQYKTPELQSMQTPGYHVEGQVVVEKQNDQTKFILDNVKLVIPNQKTITVKGNFGEDKEAVFSDLQINDGTHSAVVKGRLQLNPSNYKLNGEIQNTFNDQANVNVKAELRTAPDYNVFLQIIHGKDLSSKTNKLTLGASLKMRRKSPQDFLYETKNTLSYPLIGIDSKFEAKLEPKKVEYETHFQYNEFKVGSELEVEVNKKTQGDFDVEFEVFGLGQRVEVDAKREINGDESKVGNSLTINGKKFEAKGKIKHHIKPQDINIGCDLDVKIPSHSDVVKITSNLIINLNEMDLSQKITSGAKVYVDVFLKANKAGSANGLVKINLDNVVVNGNLKANKGSGNGEILFDFPLIKKQLKADTTFTIHEPNYNVVLNIYPLFSEDKNKKITLSTETKWMAHNLESKNFVDLMGNKMEINGKYNLNGQWINGKLHADLELISPNNQYLSFKLNRDITSTRNDIKGNAHLTLEYRHNKNQAGSKLDVKGTLNHFNQKERTIDVEYVISTENGNGKNLNLNLGVKRWKEGDQRNLAIKSKLYGPLLKNPLVANYNSKYTMRSGNWHLESTYGTENALNWKGSLDFGSEGGRAIKGAIDVDLKTSSKLISKLAMSGSGMLQKTDKVLVKLEGSANAVGDGKTIVDLGGSTDLQLSDKEGKLKLTCNCNNKPVSLEMSYNRQENDQNRKLHSNLVLNLNQNQNIKVEVTATRQGLESKLDLTLNLPTSQFKNNHILIVGKRSEDGKHVQGQVDVTSDGKKWVSTADVNLSELAPSFNFVSTCPEGHKSQLYGKVNKLTDRELNGELKIDYPSMKFILDSSVDAVVENVDDFHIKGYIHCPTVDLDKVQFDVQNKPAKTGRKIQVNAKSGDANLLSGSTNYQAREEKGKMIIEGSGSFKVKDQTKSANFKYIRQNLMHDKNGENGIEISFDAGLGNKAIDAELKVTNKQFRILNSYCEEKKECAHVELDSKLSINDHFNFNQELEIAVDLRKLGLSHEFGLKAVTTRKEYVMDHTVDVHFQSQDNSKYQYSIYVHPKEAGASLTTPKRVIAAEAKFDLPKALRNGGRASGQVAFYLDKKNQPNQKAQLDGWVTVDPKKHNMESEITFTAPGMQQPLKAKARSHGEMTNNNKVEYTSSLEVTGFAQPNQKIEYTNKKVVDWSSGDQFTSDHVMRLTFTGLNIDCKYEENIVLRQKDKYIKYSSNHNHHAGNVKYNSAVLFELSPKQLQLLLRLLNLDLLTIKSQMELTKDHQKIHSEIGSHGCTPLISNLEVKNFNTIKFNLARKDKPNNQLKISSAFIPSQIADVRAEISKEGATHDLAHVTMKLDEANFMKFDYGLQSKNINELLIIRVKNDVNQHLSELRKAVEDLTKQSTEESKLLRENFRKAIPNLKPSKDYYTNELNKIKEEILADKTIQQFSELLHNVYVTLSEVFGDSFAKIGSAVEEIFRTFEELFGKTWRVIETELLPQVQQIAMKVFELVKNVLSTFADVVLTYILKIAEILEKYQPELKQISTAISEFSQDIGRVLIKGYERLSKIIRHQLQELYNEVKALPIFEEMKAQYQELIEHGLPNGEALLNTYKDLVQTVKDVAPSDELKKLIELIGDYIETKLRNQPVDDMAALEKIASAAIAVLKKLTSVFATQPSPEFQKFQMPLTLNLLSKLPRLTAVRFSALSYLLHEDAPGLEQFLLSWITHPRNWVPPFPLYGLVIQGQHIFTFDGKHLTFPGNCDYLLVRDAVNGNFTVAGTYTNGIMTAISLSDRSGNLLTLKKGGQVLLNGKPVELPTRKPTISAFRGYEHIDLVTDYGVHVICGEQLIGCGVRVSGFYHGQVRGLLGNGNNEPYDDFTMPNGKIVTAESDFGNSYKMGSGCAAVQAVDHHHAPTAPACDKLFGWESELRYCFPFVNTDNFKMACAHGLAAGVKDTELAVAVGYAAKCNHLAIPVHVPSQFVKCHNGEQPRDVGDVFSVKTPGKLADIVLLIDTVKANEVMFKEFVQPLVRQLVTDFAAKGVSDVNFHLVAWRGENQWPSHITVNGKLAFKGQAPPGVRFAENPARPQLQTNCKFLNRVVNELGDVLHDLRLALGLDLQARTYFEALQYPFRAGAIRTFFVVAAEPCEQGRFLPIQVLRTLFFKEKSIHLNVLTPFRELKLKNKPAADVIGFSGDHVLSFGGKKAKTSAEALADLTYKDFCVDYTINNGGNVFVADNFLRAKNREQFVQAASHAVVEQATAVEQGFDCECKFVTPFTAQNVCWVVSAKQKAAGAKKAKN